jgi:hypothetical protein
MHKQLQVKRPQWCSDGDEFERIEPAELETLKRHLREARQDPIAMQFYRSLLSNHVHAVFMLSDDDVFDRLACELASGQLLAKRPSPRWRPRNPSSLPMPSREALAAAMILEGIPIDWFNDLAWIMAQESGGVVNRRNPDPKSSARGLFQLLRKNYDLNPHGESSFGNPVEECQGGIRYIKHRYHSASRARRFWELNHWY